MARVRCPRCGATVEASRTGRDFWQWSSSDSFRRQCEEMKARRAAGEQNPMVQCEKMERAVAEAFHQGRF